MSWIKKQENEWFKEYRRQWSIAFKKEYYVCLKKIVFAGIDQTKNLLSVPFKRRS